MAEHNAVMDHGYPTGVSVVGMTKPDVRPETLDEFSALLDDHAGAHVGFADTVRRLAELKAQVKPIEQRRKEINTRLREHYERGDTVVQTGPGEGVELAMTRPSAVRTYRAVSSAVVKKRRPKLWAQCQVSKPWTQVKAPASFEVKAVALPPDPGAEATLEAVLRVQAMIPTTTELSAEEQECKDRLAKIAADFGWDGLPLEFADQWVVGTRRMQFDEERLRAVDPEAYEELAEERSSGGVSRLRVGDVGLDGDAYAE